MSVRVHYSEALGVRTISTTRIVLILIVIYSMNSSP